MSATSLQRGLCRCCGTITNKCKILTEKYDILGQTEVYADLLTNTFGVKLSNLTKNDKLVCTSCVAKLKNAYNFKILVLQTERDYKTRMLWTDSKSANKRIALGLVEADLTDAFDEYDNPDMDNMQDGLDDELSPELLQEYKMLDDIDSNCSETILVNHSKDQLNDRRYLGKVDKCKEAKWKKLEGYYELNSNNDVLVTTKAKITTKVKNITKPVLMKSKSNRISDNLILSKDMNFMLDANITAIINYSYVCPFKSRFNHIICYYCFENFVDPDLLRKHTITHDPFTFKYSRWSRNTKIDLKRIDCRLCSEKINDLETFKRHLVASHGKRFYLESKDCVLPYVLEKGVNRCAICQEEFPSFFDLNKHMNVHFSYYMCEACGLGFMDQISLAKHSAEHGVKKRYPCKTCGRTFKAKYSRMLHIMRIHKKSPNTVCTICDKLLPLHEKQQHMLESHGETLADLPCIACDKMFKTRRLLTYHLRREHMTAYKFSCTLCSRKFYTQQSLSMHMPTHTGERRYKCKICEKTYPRMKTLKEHMRIHNNDRRYKCTICSQAFVQNSSLKGHMRSKHPAY